MASKRHNKRLVAAALMIAGVTAGVSVAHAAKFADRAKAGASQDLTQVPPPVWPTIAPTCTTDCTIALDAGTGAVDVADTTALPSGSTSVPFLGFRVGATGDHTLAGGATSTIKVPVGTTMTITLTGVPLELSFPSLPAGDVSHSGNTYTVHATKVGTSVFQPGSNADAPRQIAQGLVGTLVVTPAACDSCAYASATPFADEAIVATTDLDPEFAANPGTFDMAYFGQPRDANDRPRKVYHLINGKSFPDTEVIDVRSGDSVLLRYVNAGVTDKTMGMLGLRQSLLGRNASAYTDPQTLIAPLVGPGETADVAISVPGTATAGQRYSLVDQGRQMNHGTASGFGGALTFLNVWTGNAAAPTVSAVAYDTATSTLTATGQSSAAGLNIDGFQTAVTNLPADVPVWTATTPLPTPAPTAAISTTVTAAAGQTVWVRVSQGGVFSTPGSVQVPAPVVVLPPTVDGLAYSTTTSTLTATGHSSASTESINGYQTAVTALASDTPTWSSTAAVTPPVATASISANITATAGQFVWVRVQQGTLFSTGANVQVPAPVAQPPTVNTLTYDAGTSGLTAAGHASATTLTITGYQTAVTATSTGTPTWSTTTAIATPAANVSILANVPATSGQFVWVRVQQDGTLFSAGANIQVVAAPAPPVVNSATTTFTAPDQLTINASSTSPATISAAEVSVGTAAATAGTGTAVTAGTFGATTYSATTTLTPAPTGPTTVWVRVKDSTGLWSAAVGVVVP